MGGGRLERGVALGLLFAVLMNAQLLIPNPLMPRDVRLIHLLETAPSNLLLGLVVAMVLQRRRCGDPDDR